MVLIIIYIGAVLVLFIFVILMLDLREFKRELELIDNLIYFIFFFKLVNIMYSLFFFNFKIKNVKSYLYNMVGKIQFNLDEIFILGLYLYDNSFFILIINTIILLIAMLGSIGLSISRIILNKRLKVNN